MIGNAYYLAFRYMRSAPWRTLTLVFGTSVAFFMPFFTYLAAHKIENKLLARGDSSPILIGHKGNEFDLTSLPTLFQKAYKLENPFK